MSESTSRIMQFLEAVRRELDRHRLHVTVAWSLLAVGVLAVCVGVGYIFRGMHVPFFICPFAVVIGGILAWGCWLVRRVSLDWAAHRADRHFDLNDGVSTAFNFAKSGKRGGFYLLQSRWTANALDGLDVLTMRRRPPWRLWGCAIVAYVVTVALGFVPPDPAIAGQMAVERATEAQTETLNEQLETFVESLLEEATKEELELLEPDKLREWVDGLEKQKDLQEAMRQYARLEQKLSEVSKKLSRKEDECLLDQAAEELKKASETKKLGEKLAQKKYDQAAKELEKLKDEATCKLGERRERHDRLKAAASRMAQASRELARRKSCRNGSCRKNSTANASKQSQEDSGKASSACKLGQQVEQLDEATRQCQQSWSQCEECQKKQGQCSKRCLSKLNQAGKKKNQCLSSLNKSLNQLNTCRNVQNKLAQMRQKLGQCQSSVAGLCQMTYQQNGKKAGQGTDSSVNDSITRKDGDPAMIEGLKGDGPSLIAVESADEGTGTSSRRATEANKEYKRQVESFVEREDVPEQVKSGVKRYFQGIHGNEDSK